MPNYLTYSLVYVALALVYWLVGLGLATVYARRRRAKLLADLARGG